MSVNMVVIQYDADLAEAQDRVTSLMTSEDPAELAQLRAQALLVAAYEAECWPREPIDVADVLTPKAQNRPAGTSAKQPAMKSVILVDSRPYS